MVSGGKSAGTTNSGTPKRPIKLSQEAVVVGISALLFLIFSISLNNFLSEGNIIALLKNVSILGTLAVGMAVVVISSYLPEIMAVSDRILVVKRGRVVEEMMASDASEEKIMFAAFH